MKKELIKMFKDDQRIRTIDPYDINIDKKNTQKLKTIINKKGWPTSEKYNNHLENYAWAIVQHADFDMKFQEKCLELMKKLPKLNNRQRNIAYLTDRILVNKRKKQIYGTQFYINRQKKIVPRPIKDKKNLEKRRKSMNLESFKNYEKRMKKLK